MKLKYILRYPPPFERSVTEAARSIRRKLLGTKQVYTLGLNLLFSMQKERGGWGGGEREGEREREIFILKDEDFRDLSLLKPQHTLVWKV